MTMSHVLSRLLAKRAELVAERAALCHDLAALDATLHHLDAVIALFDPAVTPAALPPAGPRRMVRTERAGAVRPGYAARGRGSPDGARADGAGDGRQGPAGGRRTGRAAHRQVRGPLPSGTAGKAPGVRRGGAAGRVAGEDGKGH
jgi:hypothetical protein